ncbi:hypothetical protein VTI28DRAFT_5511 [Corynascus sepedonium]
MPVGAWLGKALVEAYLTRPNHTVIGSVRDKQTAQAQGLLKLPTAEGSKLLLVKIDSLSNTDAAEAVKELQTAGVNHLDVVIANAGGTVGEVKPLTQVTAQSLLDNFAVNTVGPVLLFQAVHPLLEKASKDGRNPKWITVGSAAGSITNVEKWKAYVVPAYGTAKAGVHWITVAAHSGNPWLVALAAHPGFVQTESGNRSARGIGLEKAPDTVEKSIAALTKLIDGATREETSGKFWHAIEETTIPW